MKTKTYLDSIELADTKYQIEFTGSDEIGKSNPIETNVVLKSTTNGIQNWARSFGNQAMPDGAWNGFKIIANIKNAIYIALGSSVHEVDPGSGNILNSALVSNTVVRQIESSAMHLFVLSDYYRFSINEFKSNLICLDASLKTKWKSELPDEKDLFANSMRMLADHIQCSTWASWNCTIDLETGKISKRVFCK